eukprot:scaffold121299_cov28-Tisochrysis_lutea.AAC.1
MVDDVLAPAHHSVAFSHSITMSSTITLIKWFGVLTCATSSSGAVFTAAGATFTVRVALAVRAAHAAGATLAVQ